MCPAALFGNSESCPPTAFSTARHSLAFFRFSEAGLFHSMFDIKPVLNMYQEKTQNVKIRNKFGNVLEKETDQICIMKDQEFR